MPELITLGETMVMFSPEQNGPLRYVQRFQKRIAGTESNVAIGLVRLGHSVAGLAELGMINLASSSYAKSGVKESMFQWLS